MVSLAMISSCSFHSSSCTSLQTYPQSPSFSPMVSLEMISSCSFHSSSCTSLQTYPQSPFCHTYLHHDPHPCSSSSSSSSFSSSFCHHVILGVFHHVRLDIESVTILFLAVMISIATMSLMVALIMVLKSMGKDFHHHHELHHLHHIFIFISAADEVVDKPVHDSERRKIKLGSILIHALGHGLLHVESVELHVLLAPAALHSLGLSPVHEDLPVLVRLDTQHHQHQHCADNPHFVNLLMSC